MKSQLKRPEMELNECGKALREVRVTTPAEYVRYLIDEANLHLERLQKASINCGEDQIRDQQINAFIYHIGKAEEVLKRQQRLISA